MYSLESKSKYDIDIDSNNMKLKTSDKHQSQQIQPALETGGRRASAPLGLPVSLQRMSFRKSMLFVIALQQLAAISSFRSNTPFQRPSAAFVGTKRLLLSMSSSSPSLLAMKRRQTKQATMEKLAEQHSRIRHVMTSTQPNSTDAQQHPLFQVKVHVCEELRNDLRLSGREKRGRVFLERDSAAVASFRSLKGQLHGFFAALRKDTYLLSGSFPRVDEEGKVIVDTSSSECWPITTDEHVKNTFQKADSFYQNNTDTLTRPAIVIHVRKDPDLPPPAPLPDYLQNLPDPTTSTHMTMLSFYSFPASPVPDVDATAAFLRRRFALFHALGRVYVAPEGINAQMSVPTNVLDSFIDCCHDLPDGIGAAVENGINVDPVPLHAVDEYPTAGTDGQPPFRALHVRVRPVIVADGFAETNTYNWQQAGYDMPPLEWHARLLEAQQQQQNATDAPVVLDCRNAYETDLGRFEGAEPLETEKFRESWDVLKAKLADTPKDAPIMTYCTGGIRCVKVGAYLTQELGFTNVSRLAGGIIAYDRTLKEEKPEAESLFKGTNFVFDGRLARPITDDEMGTCLTCGSATALVSNCRNDNCHKRMMQCEDCRTSFSGTCSNACHHRLKVGGERSNGAVPPQEMTSPSASPMVTTSFGSLEDYSMGHSSPVPSIYPEMEHNTRALIPSGSHMVSGSSQGRLLKQFASLSGGRVLELGTFTGYATACLLEGAKCAPRPFVMSLERDPKAYDVAVAQIKLICEFGIAEAGAEALCALRNNAELPHIPSDITELQFDGAVPCQLRRVSDGLATVEEMTRTGEQEPFDMIFLDADKTRLMEYMEAFLGSDHVLKPGGVVLVDNVLWKGLVLEAAAGGESVLPDSATSEEIRRNRRARKLANKMHRFNSAIVQDDRAEVLVLPIRDGLSVIRKSSK